MSSIYAEILQQKQWFKRRYKDVAEELERLRNRERDDDEKMYYIRYGQMCELELVYGNLFMVNGNGGYIWKDE